MSSIMMPSSLAYLMWSRVVSPMLSWIRAGVEDRVVGLGWVRDKVVVVEVGDECVEF